MLELLKAVACLLCLFQFAGGAVIRCCEPLESSSALRSVVLVSDICQGPKLSAAKSQDKSKRNKSNSGLLLAQRPTHF